MIAPASSFRQRSRLAHQPAASVVAWPAWGYNDQIAFFCFPVLFAGGFAALALAAGLLDWLVLAGKLYGHYATAWKQVISEQPRFHQR